jgi:hypothetical protein
MRIFAAANNTTLPQPRPVEVSTPLSLEEDFNAKQAAWEKQSQSLEKLRETFDAEKLTCNPSRYSFLRDQIEQLTAIVVSLKSAMDEAEAKFADFQFAEQKRATEAAAQAKRSELTSELNAVDTQLLTLDITYRQLPDQMRMLQGRRNMILSSLANL